MKLIAPVSGQIKLALNRDTKITHLVPVTINN
jgi:hypothetical protein